MSNNDDNSPFGPQTLPHPSIPKEPTKVGDPLESENEDFEQRLAETQWSEDHPSSFQSDPPPLELSQTVEESTGRHDAFDQERVAPEQEKVPLEHQVLRAKGELELVQQKIEIGQSRVDRFEKEVQFLRQEKESLVQALKGVDQKSHESQEHLKNLGNQINEGKSELRVLEEKLTCINDEIKKAQHQSRQLVQDESDRTTDKIKVIADEFERKKTSLEKEFKNFKQQHLGEMEAFKYDLQEKRSLLQAKHDAEFGEKRERALQKVEQIIATATRKAETIIASAENAVMLVQKESDAELRRRESASAQKCSEMIRSAQDEADEIRKRTHLAEISFLTKKNTSVNEIRASEEESKRKIEKEIELAEKRSTKIRVAAETYHDQLIETAKEQAEQILRDAREENIKILEQQKADFTKEAGERSEEYTKRQLALEEDIAREMDATRNKSQNILAEARERAQIMTDLAKTESEHMLGRVKMEERTIIHDAHRRASELIAEAEEAAEKIVSGSAIRTSNIDKAIEDTMAEAVEEASEIRFLAEDYAEKVRREVPDASHWQEAVDRVRNAEKAKFHSVINSTVQNLFSAIEQAMGENFSDLTPRKNPAIAKFVQVIGALRSQWDEHAKAKLSKPYHSSLPNSFEGDNEFKESS